MACRRAIALIQSFESCRLTAYQDSGGIWTIGWGHTRGVVAGMTCSQAQADQWFRDDIARAEAALALVLKYPRLLNENELGGLISFAFNCKGFATSSVIRAANQNPPDMNAAAKALPAWDHARVGGKLVVVNGLLRRRTAEAALMLDPVEEPTFAAFGAEPAALPLSALPENTGISTVEAPPTIGPARQTVGYGTAVATVAGVAEQAIDKIQPVHDKLALLGLSTEYLLYATGGLLVAGLLAASVGFLAHTWRARA